MYNNISTSLVKLARSYELKEIAPLRPAFRCGTSYLVDYNGANGKCWFYESSSHAALIYLDLRFEEAFVFETKHFEYIFMSFFPRLNNARSVRNEEQITLEQNTLYTNLLPFHKIQTCFSPGSSLQGIVILFTPDHLQEQIFKYTGNTIRTEALDTCCKSGYPSISEVPSIIKQITGCNIRKSSDLARVYFNSKIRELLVLFLDALHSASSDIRLSPPRIDITHIKSDDRHQIELLIQYLRENPGNNISLPELTEVAHMSTRKMTSLFKMITGLTIQEYRDHLRMDLAQKMLGDLNYSIGDIADRLGFSTTSSFTNFFKRHMGVSPRQYRAS